MLLTRASALLPLALIGVLIVAFVAYRPLDFLARNAPPVETLAVERVTLDTDGIHVSVRAAGSEDLRIAQVQVDGAYWRFSQTPAGPIGYLGTARIDIPYPWVAGEAHRLTFVTSTGLTFEHTVEVAVASVPVTVQDIAALAMAGLVVGFLPILIGYAFHPALQSYGENGRQFALALTIGLLMFLLIDTLVEAQEIAGKALSQLNASVAMWLGALTSFIVLLAIGRRSGKAPEGVALALFIAIGIGLHNLGEGLAIGASLAVGEVALASFLVLGFAIHNVTEGIAIIAPIPRQRITILLLVGLAVVAGAPAMLGTIGGAFAYAPLWVALAFGVGAGAIMQVIFEVSAFLLRHSREADRSWFHPAALTGFIAGVGLMWATALLVRA
jgi:zinc transporter ZupT